jgi:ribosomal protein S18 acetylase RimI-like enzyme
VIVWVAVEPQYSGRSICAQLIGKVLEMGAERLLPQSQISTYLGNEAAINAYKKLGFRINHERINPDFARLLGPGGMLAMTRELAPARSISFAKSALIVAGLC